jgi:hypothetical protein
MPQSNGDGFTDITSSLPGGDWKVIGKLEVSVLVGYAKLWYMVVMPGVQ